MPHKEKAKKAAQKVTKENVTQKLFNESNIEKEEP